MKAYHQGTIDYFCGVYATINAFRWAVRDQKMLSYEQGCSFYQYLMDFLINKNVFQEVLYHGTNGRLMTDLLNQANLYVKETFGLSLNFTVPYENTEKTTESVISEISNFLKQERTAWIVRLNNKKLGDHWSVGTEVKPDGKISLFDSYGCSCFDGKKTIWVPDIKVSERTDDNPTGMPKPVKGKTFLLKEGQILIKVSAI